MRNIFCEATGPSDHDRAYFERYPTRVYRIRRAFASELKLATISNERGPKGHSLYVAVRLIAPGVRCRIGFWTPHLPRSVQHEKAAEIFAWAVENYGAVPEAIRKADWLRR